MRERSEREALLVLGMLFAVAIPTALTHLTVKVPVWDMHLTDNPTPYGYSVSLLIFLVPILLISTWHLREGIGFDQKAFLWSAVVMAGIGVVLDIAFGYSFFVFPNQAATLGIRIPAWHWGEMTFVGDYLPIEEFGFYILGAIFMMSTYLWAGQNWVVKDGPKDYHAAALKHRGIIKFSPILLGVWIVILAAGLGYRYWSDGGLAGYFLFVMTAGALPTVALIHTARKFVNWHAMAFAFIALVLISIIWEASLGVPYSWWNYKPDEMMGIFIPGWTNLPLEAVMVWCIGVWDAVIIYECVRIYHHQHESPVMRRLFGDQVERTS